MVQERKKENKSSLNTYCMPHTSYVSLQWILKNTLGGEYSSLWFAEKQKMQKGKVTCSRLAYTSLYAHKPQVLISHRVAEIIAWPDTRTWRKSRKPSVCPRGHNRDHTHTPQPQHHKTVRVISLSLGSFPGQAATVLCVELMGPPFQWCFKVWQVQGEESWGGRSPGGSGSLPSKEMPPPRSSTNHFLHLT